MEVWKRSHEVSTTTHWRVGKYCKQSGAKSLPSDDRHSTTEQEAVATWPLLQTQTVLVVPRRPGRYPFLFYS